MRTLLLAELAALIATVSGCAPAPLTKADVDGRIVCDADRMDQVERAARHTFKDVHWVNCPRAVLRAM